MTVIFVPINNYLDLGIRTWLETNVGEKLDSDIHGTLIGKGWKFEVEFISNSPRFSDRFSDLLLWKVSIDDDNLATQFKLRFL